LPGGGGGCPRGGKVEGARQPEAPSKKGKKKEKNAVARYNARPQGGPESLGGKSLTKRKC